MPDEIHPELDEKLGELASDAGLPKGTVISQIERSYGIDLATVSDEDAEKFVTAFNDGDPDRVAEVLRDNGVEDDDVERFLEFVEDETPEDTDPAGNGHGPDTGVSQTSTSDSDGDTEYLTRSEAREMMDDVADKVATQVTAQIDSARSQQAPAQGAQGGQNQTQAALAEAIAHKFLSEGGSNKGAAMLGEKLQSKAMESAMQRMFAPDPFDIMRMKWAQQQADEFMADDELKDMMDMSSLYKDPEDGDESEDEGSGLWKFGGK